MAEIANEDHSKSSLENIILGITLLFVLFFASVMMSSQHLTGDYPPHIEYAQLVQFSPNFSIPLPHFLYHIIVSFFTGVTSFSARTISILLMALCIALIVYILWKYIRLYNQTLSPFWLCLIVITAIIMAPASVLKFNFEDPNFYFTYLHSSPYHNPTFLLARPLVLLTTLLSIKVFDEERLDLRMNLSITLLLIIGTLAKPNYMIAFLPAIVLFAGWHLYQKKHIQWKSLIFGIVIPSILLLLWQFSFTYLFETAYESTSIVINPMAVFFVHMQMANLNRIDILINLFLAIMFPLSLMLMYSEARKDKLFIFSWLIFLVAMSQSYLLAETGDKLAHGNFLWGGHFALFILYVVSVITVAKLKLYSQINGQFVILTTSFLAHLLSGIIWIFYNWHDPGFIQFYW